MINDLVAYLKIIKSFLCTYVIVGQVPSNEVGRHWRFRKETIDRRQDQGDSGSITGEIEKEK